MARAVCAALALFTVSVAPVLAASDDIPDEIHLVADEYGLSPGELWGAVRTTGIWNPRDYLCAVGEGPCTDQFTPAVPKVASAASAAFGVWDRLAVCESGGNWAANTGNGYFGGIQEDMTFWRNYGGTAYASRPDLASRSAQIAVAQVGLSKQGWGAWPSCSRRLGLR